MDTKDMQCLLLFLKDRNGNRYYTGQVDGIWGSRSRSALRAFQSRWTGLDPTGEGDEAAYAALRQAVAEGFPETEDAGDGSFWQEICYFTREEFRCKCGGKYCDGFPAEPREQLVRIADRLRKNLGVPITVVSGLRCPEWNRIQGGVADSQHMYGEAADIWAAGCSQAQVEAELDRIGGVRYHYPIDGSSNVHFDIPKGVR